MGEILCQTWTYYNPCVDALLAASASGYVGGGQVRQGVRPDGGQAFSSARTCSSSSRSVP
jgi:hypothetical protein